MGLEILTYPFLFVAIFFESFILVTFLSKPARLARARTGTPADAGALPTMAVVVPCYNEATTLSATCESLLALDYPHELLEVILVNDGSTDGTPEVMDRFASHPQVRVIHQANGGKHTALNAGIAATNAEFVGCLDADSFVDAGALREIVPCFADAQVAAVTAAMSVHTPSTLLQHMQNAEYIFGITLRHTLASVNGLYVTPGPFSFYRHSVISELGGFRSGHQTEDMEMALRMQQAGYSIENAVRARVYTKAPRTLLKLLRQRARWTTGFLRNVLGEYRGLVGNRRYSALGMLVLPFALLAIVSGMLIFTLVLFQLGTSGISALEVRAGIPLAYALLPHGSFDWFYVPASVYLALIIATLLASLSVVVIGKHISKTPGNLVLGCISYVLLYGFVAPLWLVRATSDVALGKHRRWR